MKDTADTESADTERSTEAKGMDAGNAHNDIDPENGLRKNLKNRHIQLIALGGAIGTGLFYGSAESIKLAGPSILLAYLIGGLVIFLILRALGEMSTNDPRAGAFSYYAARYWHPRAGFISGWNYWANYILVSMVELSVVGTFVQYWFTQIPAWVSSAVFMVVITAANLLGVRAFGEFEFWFAIIKIAAVIAMVIVGLTLIFLAVPNSSGIIPGFSNLFTQQGGFFPHGFLSAQALHPADAAQASGPSPSGLIGFLDSFQFSGMLMALVVVMFSFGGTELIGIAAAEADDPGKSIPKATNEVVWRILAFYIAAPAVIMAVVPWQEIGRPDARGVVVSPFVQIFNTAGFSIAADILNFVCLTAVISVYNSGLYSNSRMLYSLSRQGNAPKYLGHVNKRGVPVASVLTSAAITAIAVVVVFLWPDFAFTYLLAIATFAAIINWSMIAVTQMKFRRYIGAREARKLTFKLPLARITPWIIISFMVLLYILMWLNPSYRVAAIIGPVWAAVLFIASLITHPKGRDAAGPADRYTGPAHGPQLETEAS